MASSCDLLGYIVGNIKCYITFCLHFNKVISFGTRASIVQVQNTGSCTKFHPASNLLFLNLVKIKAQFQPKKVFPCSSTATTCSLCPGANKSILN